MKMTGEAEQLGDMGGLPDAARRQRVVYVRPEDWLLVNATAAGRAFLREALSGRFDTRTLREAKAVIDRLLTMADQTEVV